MYTFTSHKHKVMLSRFKVGDSVLTFDAIVPFKQKQRFTTLHCFNKTSQFITFAIESARCKYMTDF